MKSNFIDCGGGRSFIRQFSDNKILDSYEMINFYDVLHKLQSAALQIWKRVRELRESWLWLIQF